MPGPLHRLGKQRSHAPLRGRGSRQLGPGLKHGTSTFTKIPMNMVERICTLTCVFLSSMLSFGIAEPAAQYRAEACFTFTLPGNADSVQAEAFVLANIPDDEPSISLTQVRNTTFFVLSVTAEKPEDAALRANKAVGLLEQRLRQVMSEAVFKVWEKAEPPRHPFSKGEASK